MLHLWSNALNANGGTTHRKTIWRLHTLFIFCEGRLVLVPYWWAERNWNVSMSSISVCLIPPLIWGGQKRLTSFKICNRFAFLHSNTFKCMAHFFFLCRNRKCRWSLLSRKDDILRREVKLQQQCETPHRWRKRLVRLISIKHRNLQC